MSLSPHFQWKGGFSGPACIRTTYMSNALQAAERDTAADQPHDNKDTGPFFTLWRSCCSSM